MVIGHVYLNSDDLNKLARDITQTVSIVSDETAGYIPSSEDSIIIAKLLETLNEETVSSQFEFLYFFAILYNF